MHTHAKESLYLCAVIESLRIQDFYWEKGDYSHVSRDFNQAVYVVHLMISIVFVSK